MRGRLGLGVGIVTFLAVSIPLSALWPRVAAALAGRLDEPVAVLLVRTNPDVVWSDHGLDGEREIVLGNNARHRLPPVLARATSLAPPILVSLIVAVCVVPAWRERVSDRRGLRRLAIAVAVVVIVELSVGSLAIGYALAVDNGRSPGTLLRLATVTGNAARAFVPFVAVLLAAWPRPAPTRSDDETTIGRDG